MNAWFLSAFNPWLLLPGLIILIAGIGLLYRAWQQPHRQWPLASLGWIALLLVHWPLGLALGFDRGWAIAAILPGFIALLWLGMTTPWQSRDSRKQQKSTRDSAPVTHKVALRTRMNHSG